MCLKLLFKVQYLLKPVHYDEIHQSESKRLFTSVRKRNGQVGQLPYQLGDWYGKLYICHTNIS